MPRKGPSVIFEIFLETILVRLGRWGGMGGGGWALFVSCAQINFDMHNACLYTNSCVRFLGGGRGLGRKEQISFLKNHRKLRTAPNKESTVY